MRTAVDDGWRDRPAYRTACESKMAGDRAFANRSRRSARCCVQSNAERRQPAERNRRRPPDSSRRSTRHPLGILAQRVLQNQAGGRESRIRRKTLLAAIAPRTASAAGVPRIEGSADQAPAGSSRRADRQASGGPSRRCRLASERECRCATGGSNELRSFEPSLPFSTTFLCYNVIMTELMEKTLAAAVHWPTARQH